MNTRSEIQQVIYKALNSYNPWRRFYLLGCCLAPLF
jgi:hypothetical protein